MRYELDDQDRDDVEAARADAMADARMAAWECMAPRCSRDVDDAAMLCDSCLDLYYEAQ